MYEVKTEAYSGPMAKLLELIEEKQLEITRVNLATVTADFIRYIEGLGDAVMPHGGVTPDILSDFIVVAARLLLIKSKILLPTLELTDEEEGDILDLEHRLKIYREFKNASQHIKSLWDKNQIAHSRPLLSSLGEQKFFYPSRELTTDQLTNAMTSLFSVLKGLIPETKGVRMTVVTLQEKIAELTKRLSEVSGVTMKGKFSKHEKGEIIVMFLAVLHMLANRLASVEQTGQFSDIIVSSTKNELSLE